MKEIIIIPATIDNRIFGNEKKVMRVASYSRVSTEFEDQLTSFEHQKTYYTDLILKTKGWSLVGTYADRGISGTTENRPDFQKLMRHCRRGKIDLIITKSVSRFSRNIVITLEKIRELKALGVGIYFEKENINTLEENSEFILALMASIAQEESHSLSQNVRRGIQMQMEKGVVRWNYKQNFGFKKGANDLPEIVEEQAETIRKIFRYYMSGDSDDGVAKRLNSEKILTQNGKYDWKKSMIQRILQNERYCGDVILQKTFIENHITKKVKVNNGEFPKIHIKNNHSAIVPREIFEKVTAERARRTNKRSVSPKTLTEQGKFSSIYALSEILVCGCCMSPMQRKTWLKRPKKGQETTEKQFVWTCTKRKKYGAKYCESSVTVDEKSLHKAIMRAINETTESRQNIVKFVSNELHKTLLEDANDTFDLADTERKIESITNEISDIIAKGMTSENLDLIKTMNAEAVNLSKLVAEYKQNYASEEVDKKAQEIEEFLTHKPQNLGQYDDKLVRQIVGQIKVISADLVKVVFKNGKESEQTLDLVIKPRNKSA